LTVQLFKITFKLGKSNTVGLPMAMLMMKKEATVSVCNADTPEQLEINIVKHADILISAVGKAHLVKAEWVKNGAIVIDIGINSIPFNNKTGYKLVGDVDFDNVKQKVSMITPVPGGVGPMTVIMLMKATIESCERMMNKNNEWEL
jgi:methylenetetrahydrofolate dehydrogenase (NADP+)/methenyltetrahydrofolate cyclohydrolase/formyltetrahydrofolate synthetase